MHGHSASGGLRRGHAHGGKVVGRRKAAHEAHGGRAERARQHQRSSSEQRGGRKDPANFSSRARNLSPSVADLPCGRWPMADVVAKGGV
eukprot:267671-Prymnesium_polylepis.1